MISARSRHSGMSLIFWSPWLIQAAESRASVPLVARMSVATDQSHHGWFL
jgi:membrane-bound lytic murein transglycosylase